MSDVRASEVERQRAIHSLRESYARGDLDDEQFEARLNAVFNAQSSAELRELLPATNGDVARILATTVAVSSTDLDTVERHLSRDEHVEWIGKPDPKKRFSAGDWTMVPPGLLGIGFGIFWIVGATKAAGAFGLLGIPFLAMAFFVAFGPLIVKANRRRRTIYAVTNRRVLEIVRNWKGGGESMEAMYLRSIPNISTKAGRDGTGSVEFGLTSPGRRQSANAGLDIFNRNAEKDGLSFDDVEDPQGVADLIERLRDAAPAPVVVPEPEEPRRPPPPRAEPRLPFPPSPKP